MHMNRSVKTVVRQKQKEACWKKLTARCKLKCKSFLNQDNQEIQVQVLNKLDTGRRCDMNRGRWKAPNSSLFYYYNFTDFRWHLNI